MQDTTFVVWQNISGSGMLLALYVCAVIFLFFTEKEMYKRILLVYLPIFWIGVLLLPVTYKVVAKFIDAEIYYRFFWMLPVTLVLAYTAVQIYDLCHEKYRIYAAIGLTLVMILGGDFVYNNWRYTKAENAYHVPQKVVELCDLMHTEGREVLAIFPMELMQYVRQYDSTICLPYGRNVLVDDWNINHPLYSIMEAETVDCDALGKMAATYRCAYIVLHKERQTTGDLAQSGYVRKDTVFEYNVYYNDELFHDL